MTTHSAEPHPNSNPHPNPNTRIKTPHITLILTPSSKILQLENQSSCSGAAPGCLLGEGEMARYCCTSPEKVAERGGGGGGGGGDSDTFFYIFFLH